MWHILPYEQLLQLLDTDEQNLAILLREEDFWDVKLREKPYCRPVQWQELTPAQQDQTAKIKAVMETTMTCFAYDDLEHCRSIYPAEVYENQFSALCKKWERGLNLLKNEPMNETVLMAQAAYCLFASSLNQIRFIRARDAGDRVAALSEVQKE